MVEEGRGPRKSVIEVPNRGIDSLPCSPVLQVGVGETLVNIQHTIPRDTTKDKFVYKDAQGIVHEVEVTDCPVVPVRDLDAMAKLEGQRDGSGNGRGQMGSSGSDTMVEKSLSPKPSRVSQ